MRLRPSVWVLCRIIAILSRKSDRRTTGERRATAGISPAINKGNRGHIDVSDHRVPVTGGTINVRAYRPHNATDPLPAHILMHAGAFWTGNVTGLDSLARAYAESVPCLVLSVEYRLAPEFAYPTAAEDSYSALSWAFAHAANLDIDPTRISVGGVSAGGNLAAAVALMARDRGGPPIVFQLLELPVVDLTMSRPSVAEFGTGLALTREAMITGYRHYLGAPEQAVQPYASPMLAPDLSGLPPTMILTAEFDPLRDEGEEYGRRLGAAGVPVQVLRAKGHVHASTHAPKIVRSARRYRMATTDALRDAYRTASRGAAPG
ncbi:MAG TPA: alpha/beta hydrolase [Jatrophihabitantaceae bacterium]|nr:alpha/beta hydrolase [Jatrophihabitantaceae bacterium]